MLHRGIPNLHRLVATKDDDYDDDDDPKLLLIAWVRYAHVKRSDLDWDKDHPEEDLEETVARIFRRKLDVEVN